ncbi:MAG: hypothetical protein H6867_09740 [Rhodospirillales bacterium]|nr:hypothetical protein [Rhodospirillales bacterium]MCB9995937.1 hypothetical protein [Rhodospirillales bacterium]
MPVPDRLSLIFKGTVEDGLGRYSSLRFPGSQEINGAPKDWPGPKQMTPGSLNCHVTDFAANFKTAVEKGMAVLQLDHDLLRPAFTVPADLIKNNSLRPAPGMHPRRGDANVWRCAVENLESGISFDAWLVRRIGSAYSDIIELMSSQKLRPAYDLESGTPIKVTAFAGP